MPRGKPIGPREAEQALRLVAEGKTLAEIATIVGVSVSGINRALLETWPEEYAEAKERRNDLIRNEVWQLRRSEDAPTQRWAYDHLIKWHLPEGRETTRLEVAGTVAVQHQARLTLAHVAGLADRLGLGGSARPELPAAQDVLPEPDDR